jgi:hypothetical protein
MKSLHEGQLVTVTEDDRTMDGIVFQVLSVLKAVVAVPDGEHGSFRTVHRGALRERGPGEHDDALRKLIRKTTAAGHGAPHGRNGGAGGRRGAARVAGHRTTSK